MAQQIWAVNSLGGYLSNSVLSKQIRHAAQPLMRFRQFVDPEGAEGKNRGDKVYFNKISNISTAGGTLSETATIPKTNYVIRQGTLSVYEYGRYCRLLLTNFMVTHEVSGYKIKRGEFSEELNKQTLSQTWQEIALKVQRILDETKELYSMSVIPARAPCSQEKMYAEHTGDSMNQEIKNS